MKPQRSPLNTAMVNETVTNGVQMSRWLTRLVARLQELNYSFESQSGVLKVRRQRSDSRWLESLLPPSLRLEVFSCYEPSHVKFQTGSETRHFPHRPWWWWLSVSRPRHRKTMTSASEGRTCRSGSKGQRCHIRWCHDADARGGPSEPVTHDIRGARRLVIHSAQPPSEVARNGNLCEHGSANQACCWRRPDPSSGWLREEIST